MSEAENPLITLSTLLVDAIIGVGFPTQQLAIQCELAGMARATGSKTKLEFHWIRERLAACEEDKLQQLYTALKEAQIEAQGTPVAAKRSPIIVGDN